MSFKIYNLLREFVNPGQYDPAGDYLPYGEADAFPLKISKLVDESPVGSACISTLSDFIEGEGFSDTEIENYVVNQRGQTLAHIHNETSKSLAKFQGFAWHFTFNQAGQVNNWYAIPFENCRLGKPDDKGWIQHIHYNPYYGTTEYRKQKSICYDVFNPNPEVVKKQQEKAGKKYLGQILYYGTTKPMNRFYPVPEYWSAKYWLEVDSRIGQYHQKNLANGFLQPVMMTKIGDPNQPSSNPEYADYEQKPTVGYEFDQLVSENFMGTDRVGNLWIEWVSKAEEQTLLQSFPANNQEGYMNAIVATSKDMIATATKVPAILANIVSGASLGGDGNAIRAAVKLMQQRVVKWHHLLEREYKKVLSSFYQPVNSDISIIHYNPFPELQSVDPQVWEQLTPEEKRKWIKDNTEIELIESAANPEQVITTEQPQAKFSAIAYTNYPQKAKDNAQKAKDWMEKTGNKCVKPFGRDIMDKIIESKPISFKEIERVYKFLKKNDGYKNQQFSDSCISVEYQAWGGEAMYTWCEDKVNEIKQ